MLNLFWLLFARGASRSFIEFSFSAFFDEYDLELAVLRLSINLAYASGFRNMLSFLTHFPTL